MKTAISQLLLNAILVLVALSVFPRLAQAQQPSSLPVLKILHFNVGNGDATLIVVEDGSSPGKVLLTMLIDGGSRSMAAKMVIPGIHEQKIAALDYIIATHNDPDHASGLSA